MWKSFLEAIYYSRYVCFMLCMLTFMELTRTLIIRDSVLRKGYKITGVVFHNFRNGCDKVLVKYRKYGVVVSIMMKTTKSYKVGETIDGYCLFDDTQLCGYTMEYFDVVCREYVFYFILQLCALFYLCAFYNIFSIE